MSFSLKKSPPWAYMMWLLPLSFFTYQFILRLWPSLMMQEIMQQFAVDATAYGLLASVYYYGYAGMQIPIAVLLDRYGVRYTTFACAVVCGVAMLIFSYTDEWSVAVLTRFLVGVGSAVGFLATSKVISEWFSKAAYARMIGFSFTVGLLGAIYGGKPVSLLVERLGSQSVALALSIISLSIGVLVFLFLHTPKHLESNLNETKLELSDFRKLLSSPLIWLIAFANLLMVGSLEGFADVWGVNYLMTAHGLTQSDAAELTSFIFVGMLFGGPLLAYLSKRFGNYTVIAFAGLGLVVAFTYLLSGNSDYNYHALATLFFIVGNLCCYQVIVFAAGCELVSAQMLGITVAFLNCINMLGGSFFHTLIGFAMDLFWTGTTVDGVRQYTLESYNHALAVIPLCALVGSVIVAALGLHRIKKQSLSFAKN